MKSSIIATLIMLLSLAVLVTSKDAHYLSQSMKTQLLKMFKDLYGNDSYNIVIYNVDSQTLHIGETSIRDANSLSILYRSSRFPTGQQATIAEELEKADNVQKFTTFDTQLMDRAFISFQPTKRFSQFFLTESKQCDACKESQKKWVYLQEPINFAVFTYTSYDEVVYNFAKAVPTQQPILKVKLIIFLSTTNNDYNTFYTKVRVINGEEQFVHWTYAQRNGHNVISYNCETVEIPCDRTREIRVRSNLVQPSNLNIAFKISAYLPA